MPEQPPPQGGLGQSWFVLDFQGSYDGFTPKITGGELRGTYGPAFVETEESWTFDGHAVLRRVPEPVRVVAEASGNLTLVRRRSFKYSGQRQPAARLLSARRDDDELLLLLYGISG